MTATDDDVDAVRRVEALVDDLARSYVEHTQPQAMLLVGSGATGEVDGYSDVDLILDHDAVPVERTLETARATVGAERLEGTDWPGEGYGERYDVGGIHCQLGLGEALHRRRPRCDSRARAARRRDARTCGGATARPRAVDRVGQASDAAGEP